MISSLLRSQPSDAEVNPLFIIAFKITLESDHSLLCTLKTDDIVELIVNSPMEALHLAVRLRPAWLDRLVLDAIPLAGLGKLRCPPLVVGVPHGESKIIIGHNRLDCIRKVTFHLFQEPGGSNGGFALKDHTEGLPAEVVDGTELIRLTTLVDLGEMLDVKVDELPWMVLLITEDGPLLFRVQTMCLVSPQYLVDGGWREPHLIGDSLVAHFPLPPEGEDLFFSLTGKTKRRGMGTGRAVHETLISRCLIPVLPIVEALPGDAELPCN